MKMKKWAFSHPRSTSVSSRDLLPKPLLCLWLLMMTLLQVVVGMFIGVKDVRVPNPGIVGKPGRLECNFLMFERDYYYVHWYKNMEKFYTFSSFTRHIQYNETYPVPGVNVSLAESNHRVVTLRELSLESAGEYSCQTEAGSSLFIDRPFASANLTVVELPRKPEIIIVKRERRVGDTLMAGCLVQESRPAANLVFRVNGETVHPDSGHIREQGISIGSQPGRFKSHRVLVLPLSCRHEGMLNLTCEAHVLSVILETTLEIQVAPATSGVDIPCDTEGVHRFTTTASLMIAAVLILPFILLLIVMLTRREIPRSIHTLLYSLSASSNTDADVSKP